MPPSVPTVYCCVCDPWSRRYPEGLFGEGCVCFVRHTHKKENSLGGVTQKGGWLLEKGRLWGLSGGSACSILHTEFEFSSFSRSGDTRAFTYSLTKSQTDRTTDITTVLHIAFFSHTVFLQRSYTTLTWMCGTVWLRTRQKNVAEPP